MKTFKFKGKSYKLRNKGKEVTLGELSKIASILNSDDDFTGKWLEVLSILGGKDLVEVLPMKEFFEAVKSVQISDVGSKIKKQITVNGRTYSADMEKGEIVLRAKDLKAIEDVASKGGAWASKAFAVVYKDDLLSDNEHYEQAHLKHKAKLFEEAVMADVAAPIIFRLNKVIVENIQLFADSSEV
jgi:hypothetical protein